MIERAKRLDKIPPYLFGEISAMKAKALSEGKSLIDLGIGDPDQPTPEPIISRLCEAAKDPSTHRYDESNSGYPKFLEAIAHWFQDRFQVELDAQKEALLLIGSKEGLAHMAWAFINPGDLSLVPDPAYTVYKVNTLMAGGDIYSMPLLEENGFLPDFSKIPDDVADRAKLMFLNYPNNPTGAVATEEFYAEAVAFAKKHNLLICHDAAYSEVAYDGYEPLSILQIPGAKDVSVEFHSLSKTFNMTGWRLGFAVGNEEAISALNKMKSNIDSRQFPAIDEAGAFALTELAKDAMKSTLELYTRRRDLLVDGLNKIGWKVNKQKASLYVWARIPKAYTSIEFAKLLLEEAGVLVIPGIGYGEYGEGYVRMSMTVEGDKNGEQLKEAVRRIAFANIKWDN